MSSLLFFMCNQAGYGFGGGGEEPNSNEYSSELCVCVGGVGEGGSDPLKSVESDDIDAKV